MLISEGVLKSSLTKDFVNDHKRGFLFGINSLLKDRNQSLRMKSNSLKWWGTKEIRISKWDEKKNEK